MRQFICAACCTCLPLALITPAAGADFTARDLAAEESRFAAYSVRHGMRAAFLEFFAEPSWLLRPDPVDAKAWLRARPDPPIVLDWKSSLTVCSASVDLCFSTGPWLSRSSISPVAPAAHGQFFSVWQKQANGEWKVFIDHGISHGPAATPDSLPSLSLIAIDLIPQAPATGAAALDAERLFVARGSAAYAEVVTPRTRLLREGLVPIDGIAAIGDYLKSQEGQWTWAVRLQGASRANDFTYAVGNYTWQPREGAARKGQYLRVWVRETLAAMPRWTLAAEVTTPEPPPKT